LSADQTLIVSDASTGNNLAELPWSAASRSRVLSAAGTFTCTLPIDHWACTPDFLGKNRANPDREVTLWRNDSADFSGPIVGTDVNWSAGTITLTARDAAWYLSKRVLEIDKTYTAQDVFDIIRDLITYMTSKTATGSDGMTLGDNIIAALSRFAVNPSSATAGATTNLNLAGAARHTIQDCLDAPANDPQTGFEWKLDVSSGSTWRSVQRTLVLGYPDLGSTLTRPLTELLLADYGQTNDREEAATRVHVVGSGYTKTLQSATAAGNSVLLLEKVDDQSNITDHGVIDARAKDLRRLSQPPVRAFTVSYIPDDVLAFGAVDLGDTVPFDIRTPNVLAVTSTSRRVIQEDYTFDVDGSELVTLTFNDPLSDLG
jgi:hypothetical protein